MPPVVFVRPRRSLIIRWYKRGMKNGLRVKNYALPLLMGGLPAALLALIGYTGSFTRYIADDYCSAYWADRFGLFRSVWHWYITWSGRFSAYAADWFVAQMGARNIGIIPPVALVTWPAITAAAVYLFLRRIRHEPDDWAIALVLGVAFPCAVLTIMPSIQTSFYWWNGMRSYTLPLLMLTLFAVLYQLLIDQLNDKWRIIGACLFSLLFFFANAGLSDVYAVTQLGLLVLLAFVSIASGRSRRAAFAVFASGAAGTVLALLLIVLSPGNPAREASFPAHPGLARLLGIAWQGYAALLQSIVGEPAKLLALVGVVCAGAWAGSRTRGAMPKWWLGPGIIAAGLILSYAAYLPGSWGLSEPPPARNISVPVFFLTASLTAAASAAGAQLLSKDWSPRLAATTALVAILALNASAVIGLQHAYAARQAYIAYAWNWDAEDEEILAAKARDASLVIVPSWPNWASLDVLSTHSKNWLNQCTSGYYGIEVIGRSGMKAQLRANTPAP